MSVDTVERVVPGTKSWDQYGFEHIQRYQYFTDWYKGKDILDAASGTGYGSDYMKKNGAASVTGIDVSDEAVNFSKSNYGTGVQFMVHDCMKLEELGKKFDLVISFETIEHLQDPAAFIEQVYRVLNPGGKFICSTPNKDRLSGAGHINEFHLNELPFGEFKNAFERFFTTETQLHQSESISYFRYMDLVHRFRQLENQTKAYLATRVEAGLRKIVKKDFSPPEFFHTELMNQHPGDMVIETFGETKNWHKTYILAGTAREKKG